MYKDGKIYLAKSVRELFMEPSMANRHGLIAGATGTGKTITMKVMAESFSDMGVPVFMADVKGDLSGMCCPGIPSAHMQERVNLLGLMDFELHGYPTRFWDVFGQEGHPARVTVSDMGPVLLSRLLNLTQVQSGVLNIVFRVADDNGLLLLDLKDLRAMLRYVGENREEFTNTYGNVSSASIGAIQRALLSLEDEGGETLFGEPALDIRDWLRTDRDGRGYINILSAGRLIQSPMVYASFLLWMMTELFEQLPEVGDGDKPRMIFFFDEAHLLFDGAPKPLVQKIVQVVKLIRSKGVGIYFVSQSPADIPNEVLAQLSNRVQHALRAYTPEEQKAVRAAARAFRKNPDFDTETALQELGVGEALVSFLDKDGVPSVVERADVMPPQSLMGPADPQYVSRLIIRDEFDLKYRESVDRESAYEILERANQELELLRRQEAEEAAREKQRLKEESKVERAYEKERAREEKRRRDTIERAAANAASSVARSVSNNIVSSVMGGKKVSGKTMAKRAATNALSSVMRTGSRSIIRGLFGNKK